MNITLLKKKRKEMKLNQIELAEMIGIKSETLSLIERGVSEPRSTTLKKMSETLNVSYLDLLTNSREIKEAIKNEILEQHLKNSQKTYIQETYLDTKETNKLDDINKKIQDLETRIEQVEKIEKIKEVERFKELVKKIYGE